MESRNGRRVVISGVGVVSPCGTGTEEFWTGLAKPVESSTARRVTGFDPAGYGLARQEYRRLDRFAQFGLAAAAQALVDAYLLPCVSADSPVRGGERVGVLIGTGMGGTSTYESQVHTLRDRGERQVSPLAVPMVMPNAVAGAVSMRWGLRGPCETVCTACATGTHAIGAAARWVASGRADIVVAGGAEAPLTGTSVAAFGAMRALSPTGLSRPFDVGRDGFCAAEGAGVVVLETLESCLSRGALPYAEIIGTGSTADAFHLTAPAPRGSGAERCMRQALNDAGLPPGEVTHVNAHGTSTPLNDAAEAVALAELFGDHQPAVTSVKGVTGHPLGAAGAIEAVAVALTYRNELLPPTMGTTVVDPRFDLDVVRGDPRPWDPAPAM